MTDNLITLTAGDKITLLASYCGGENKNCTNKHPCNECIKMCNTFELMEEVEAVYLYQVGDKKEVMR